MSKITVTVKPTSGTDKFLVELETTNTVQEFKEAVSKASSIPAAEQRLIYKGQILKDERTAESYGIGNEHVVHLVRRAESSTSIPAQQQAASSPAATAQPTAAQTQTPASDPLMGAGLFGMGGLGGMGGQVNSQQWSQLMSETMNSPHMQAVMNDPEFLRSMLQSNPMIREVAERNPEMSQLLNNPQVLRDTMQIAANPSLWREHMRNTDRALSNLEAHPEGFNTLRRLYENIQGPLENAAASATDPFAALFPHAQVGGTNQQQSSTSPSPQAAAAAAPNAAPLPNPWAPTGTGGNASGGIPAGLGGLGLPGMHGMGMDPSSMMQMMQNPAIQGMMQSLMQNPAVMEQMINSNPQLRSMMDANPQMRAMMSNPEVMRQMFDPQNMQAMLQVQQAMQQLQGSPLFGQLGAAAGTPGATATPGTGQTDPNALLAALTGGFGGMGGLGALGGLGGFPAATPPVADPETAYATQLTQLQDMGFFDREANIRALQASGGNVHAAVERLLTQM